MKYLLLASVLIIPAQIFSMDNPNPKIQTNAHDELRALSSSSHSSAQENDEQNDFDYDDEPEAGSPGLPFYLPRYTKEERKEFKQKNNQELMRLARQMLAHNGDLNAALPSDRWSRNTLLTAAAEHTCHKNVLEFALANGANPNIADKQGDTPLKIATLYYRLQNITLLLDRGAHITDELLGQVCSPFGLNIFSQLLSPKRISTLKVLLDAGANPNTASLRPLYKSQYLPCLLSGLLCNSEEKFEGHVYETFVTHRKQMIDLLLQKGLNLFKKDDKGTTDWEKIQECNTKYNKYDPELFNYVQRHAKICAYQLYHPLQP